MKIVRRLDTTAARCKEESGCPAVFLTDTGDIAFIGQISDGVDLPAGSGVGPGEQLFTVPRDILISAGWAQLDN